MANTVEDKFNKLITNIQEQYKIIESDGTYKVPLSDEVDMMLKLDDDILNVAVAIKGHTPVKGKTKAPFEVVKKLLKIEWKRVTYSRRVGWIFNEWRDFHNYGRDADTWADVFDWKIPPKGKYFSDRTVADQYCQLDIPTVADMWLKSNGKQSVECFVEFYCSASQQQLNALNKFFEEETVERIQGFWDDDVVGGGDIFTGDYFYKHK